MCSDGLHSIINNSNKLRYYTILNSKNIDVITANSINSCCIKNIYISRLINESAYKYQRSKQRFYKPFCFTGRNLQNEFILLKFSSIVINLINLVVIKRIFYRHTSKRKKVK